MLATNSRRTHWVQFLQTEHFGARANETFDLSLGETTQTLTLVEVRVLSV